MNLPEVRPEMLGANLMIGGYFATNSCLRQTN